MKKIFAYFGFVLSIALVGLFTACNPHEIDEQAEAGLGIKVFFPTKVVAGQPMTISGTGMADVREVVFPTGVSVTAIEHVGNGMIRVTAPSGIASAGGKLIVRSADDEAESSQDLTLGHTVVSGFSKQDGEEISGGEQLTIFGTDLEFISRAELLDPDGNPYFLEDEDFYRKGTSTVIITIPKKNIFEGTWKGKLYTFDGQVIDLPELAYTPAADGGHWETVKTIIWENDDPAGHGAVGWSGQYRFALEGTDDNSEAIAEIPADVWEKMKTTPFYMSYTAGDSYQIRVTTGWWSVQWLGGDNDIAPWNMAERIIDNGDGTFAILVDFSEDPAILDAIDAQHLLFTGNGYTVMSLYFAEDVWIEGEGHMEIVKTSVWKNDDPAGHGAVGWSGQYRFALEGTDGNNEAIAEIPADIWEKMKTTPFYMSYTAGDSYQIRVTTGWWSVQWLGADNDIAPWNMAERIIDNGDGTFAILVDFSEDPAILDAIDAQHLLFTGNGYTVMEIYFAEEVWVGGNSGPKEVLIWENDDPAGHGKIGWSGTYRFALEGTDGNSEAIVELPADVWEKMKTTPFYMSYTADDSYQIRVTTGWWSVQWLGGDNDIAPWNMAERIIDNGDGTFAILVDFSEDPAILDSIDAQHLLFTGNGYTPMKLYFLE